MERLDAAILHKNSKAYVAYASSTNPDMRYLTGFSIGEQIIYIKKPAENGFIVVSQMEAERAARESHVSVITKADAGFYEIIETEPDIYKATAKMINQLAGGAVLVPGSMPISLARELEKLDKLHIDKDTVKNMRARKTARELNLIQQVQKETENAMDIGIKMIKNAEVRGEHLYRNGAPLTSEHIKTAMHIHLLERGCTPKDTIVSCGTDTALPHCTGTGPLSPNQPIVIDLFPRSELTGYYADMTRTVSKGKPETDIIEMYDATRNAQDLAEDMIKAGITAASVHEAVVDYFHECGYESGRQGFVHSLGHGVGLEIHELPAVSPSGETLETNNVITVEPGLYYSGTGGVRLENMGSVKKDGFKRFTNYPRDLII